MVKLAANWVEGLVITISIFKSLSKNVTSHTLCTYLNNEIILHLSPMIITITLKLRKKYLKRNWLTGDCPCQQVELVCRSFSPQFVSWACEGKCSSSSSSTMKPIATWKDTGWIVVCEAREKPWRILRWLCVSDLSVKSKFVLFSGYLTYIFSLVIELS